MNDVTFVSTYEVGMGQWDIIQIKLLLNIILLSNKISFRYHCLKSKYNSILKLLLFCSILFSVRVKIILYLLSLIILNSNKTKLSYICMFAFLKIQWMWSYHLDALCIQHLLYFYFCSVRDKFKSRWTSSNRLLFFNMNFKKYQIRHTVYLNH